MTQKRHFHGCVTQCLSCHRDVLYSWLTGMGEPYLHFYANDNNDVLIRTAWFSGIDALLKQDAPDSSVLAAIGLLLNALPGASTKYAVWSNVKCPHCRSEFPYRFKGNLKLRLEDPSVIFIDGCEIDTDAGVFVVDVNQLNSDRCSFEKLHNNKN